MLPELAHRRPYAYEAAVNHVLSCTVYDIRNGGRASKPSGFAKQSTRDRHGCAFLHTKQQVSCRSDQLQI